jgi:hypothetical protein
MSAAARMDASQALLAAIALTLALYLVPYADVVAWPLVLFSTLAHELGHGLTALALGGAFDSFYLYANASGLAAYGGVRVGWPSALVAAGGLLGPPLAALALFAAGRRAATARAGLGIFALGLAVCEVLWVRNAFGLAFVGLLAAALGSAALWAPARFAQVVTAFLAIQLSLSVWSRGDYLFTASAQTAGGTFPSDTAQIAAALVLPYWFWGGVVAALSALVLWAGWRIFRGSL